MAYINIRMRRHFRRALYSVLALSWCTGVLFFILSRWMMVEGDFGPEKHPWQFPVLMVHGAAAFLIMVSYGSVLLSHVTATWRLKRLRGLGLTLVFMLCFQIISAWMLYYLSSDEIRGWFANAHAAVGVSFPLVLTIHIIHGLRDRAEQKQRIDARRLENQSSTVPAGIEAATNA